jgi:aminoglycoside phosphotransferase (APT) family kinase protein
MPPSRMHVDEVAIGDGVVERLVADQFPQWAGLPLRRVGTGGTDNVLYRLGRELVVRLPRLREHGNDPDGRAFDRDLHWLPRLAPLLPVAVPVPIAKGLPADGYPAAWGVYSWLEGETPDVEHLAEPEALALQVVELIRALHRVELPDPPLTARGSSLARWDEPTRVALAQLEGAIDTDAATAAWDRALAAPPWTGAPVWLHGDLMPANLIVQGLRLTGAIDWGLLGLGDPAVDLAVAWNLLPARARALVREELGVDHATWERGRGWALWTGIGALAYYRETNPELAENAAFRIGQVLGGE